MPLYTFACPSEHRTEEICPVGTEHAPCHCGQEAGRVVSFGFGFVVEPAAVPEDQRRHNLALFREATEERAEGHRRAEERAQRPLQAPNLWGMAKRRAGMVRVGQEPPPSGRA